jgi:hypothetical protein
MEIANLGQSDGLPPVDWAAVAAKLDARSAPAQGPPPWNVYRIEPRSVIVTLATAPGGLTRFRF